MAVFPAAVTAAVACAVAALMPSTAGAASAGVSHSCAVLDDGTIKCVGSNGMGQLGQGTVASLGGNSTDMGDNLPSVPLGGVNFEAVGVASGNNFNCAVSATGTVKCWGLNDVGQLGLGDTNNRGGPAAAGLDMGDNLPEVDVVGVNGSSTGVVVESVSLGGSSACAVITGGMLKCWGSNSGGQLGLGDSLDRGDEAGEMGDSLPFVDLGTFVTVSSVALGSRHACAVIENGYVKCWGNNDGGQLGYEDQTPRGTGIVSDGVGGMGDSLAVVDLGTDQRAIDVGAGFFHSCALLYSGDVKCWGFGESGQLGQGSNDSIGDAPDSMGDNLPPIDLGTGRTAVALALGGAHTCAVLDDESMKCWGLNEVGTLGLGDIMSRGLSAGDMGDNLPEVPLTFGDGLGAVSNVFTGMSHTCVSGTEGGLACFGYNDIGQLGAGTLGNIGDDPSEVEALASIDFGTGVNVVTAASSGSTFNSTGTVPPAGSVPAPTPGPGLRTGTPAPGQALRDADLAGGESDDGLSSATIAVATSAGVAIFALLVVAACCCCSYRRQQQKQRRMRELVAIAVASNNNEPKTDKRVQFSKSIRPDDDVDVHPLLRGVRLDGVTSSAGTPTMTPGISSAAMSRPKAAATPRARVAPASSSTASDAGTAAVAAPPAVDSSGLPLGEAKIDSSSRASGSSAAGVAGSASGSGEPLSRSAAADPTGAGVTPAAGAAAAASRIQQAGQPDRGSTSTASAAPGGKEEEGFPQEWEEKKEAGDVVGAPGVPPS